MVNRRDSPYLGNNCARTYITQQGDSCFSVAVNQKVPTYVTTLLSIHVFVILTFMQIPIREGEPTDQPLLLRQSNPW